MAAVLQLEPRYNDAEDHDYPVMPGARLRLIEQSDRQYRPRSARSHQRAVYRRRRALAALVGLGLVLAIVRAGTTLGGSIAGPERLPHVQLVVVQPGDSLWSVAQRAAPGHDVRPIVDAMVHDLRTDAIAPGQQITVRTP
jgi:hypothetical protein